MTTERKKTQKKGKETLNGWNMIRSREIENHGLGGIDLQPRKLENNDDNS